MATQLVFWPFVIVSPPVAPVCSVGSSQLVPERHQYGQQMRAFFNWNIVSTPFTFIVSSPAKTSDLARVVDRRSSLVLGC